MVGLKVQQLLKLKSVTSIPKNKLSQLSKFTDFSTFNPLSSLEWKTSFSSRLLSSLRHFVEPTIAHNWDFFLLSAQAFITDFFEIFSLSLHNFILKSSFVVMWGKRRKRNFISSAKKNEIVLKRK